MVQEQQRLRVASRRVVQRLRGNLLSVRASILLQVDTVTPFVAVTISALYDFGSRTHIKAYICIVLNV